MHTRPGLLLSVLALVACGGSQAPAPVAKVEARAPAPAPVTCDDAAVILTPNSASDADRRTADLAQACKDDKWPAQTLTCIGSSHRPSECLDGLPNQADLAQLMDLGDEDGGGADAAAPIECDQAISTVWWYPPELDDQSPERRWDLVVRRRAIVEACEHEAWSEELKTCFQAATDASRPGPQCLEQMEPAARDALEKKMTEIDALAAKIEKTKQKPAAIACKQVVAAHYGDAMWKDKLDGFKPAERKKMIAESRAKLTTACAGWSETLRGCIVAGGGETCFQAASLDLAWGYPAAGVSVALGIPECDGYAAQMAKVIACDKLPQASRDALAKSSQELFSQVIGRPKAERASFASTCKAGSDALAQALSSLGC